MMGLPVTASAQNRVAFVTSATGSANLSTWDESADGLTGLVAADSICTTLATAGELNNSGNFVAWLSDSVDDAYCRLHNLSGKMEANCGELKLPVSAGPWVRTDGVPFAPSIEMFLTNTSLVYTPLRIDENGVALPLDSWVWTASNRDGTLSPVGNCADWDGTPLEPARSGRVDRTSVNWTDQTNIACGFLNVHLYCFETLSGPALVLPDSPGRIAFATENTGNGDLGSWPQADPGTVGIAAGDSICNNQASSAGLPHPGTYKAWLSDATTDAHDRFTYDAPWVRVDGFEIASSLADLIDGVLFTSNNLNQFGNHMSNNSAWTGTNADGTAHADHCDSWQSTGGDGREGRVNAVSEGWTSTSSIACTTTFVRLHCLSDVNPDRVYANGFE